MRRTLVRTLLALVALCACACSSAPLEVANIQTGRSLNSDNSIGTHSTRFKPTDTLYVAVITENSGSSAIVARWTLSGKVVQETKKDVSYKGHAATEFHLQYPGSLPAGDYKVEILVDGKSAGVRDLRVE
jgi:hypothetical protein